MGLKQPSWVWEVCGANPGTGLKFFFHSIKPWMPNLLSEISKISGGQTKRIASWIYPMEERKKVDLMGYNVFQ